MKRALYITKNKAYLIAGSNTHAATFERTAVNPPNAGPNEIDFFIEDTGKTLKCLVVLRDNRLVVCHPYKGAGEPRPSSIEAKKKETVVSIYRRLHENEELTREQVIARRDGASVEGLWDTVGFEVDGVKLEEDEIDPFLFERERKVFLFLCRQYFVMDARESRLRVERATYARPANSKSDIDLHFAGQPSTKAICLVQGDRMTICWSKDQQIRPSDLSSANGGTIMRLRRVDIKK